MSPTDALGKGQPFLKSVHATLQHFVKADWVDAKGQAGVMSGSQALKHRFEDVKGRLDKPEGAIAPEICDLKVFNEFEYLLDSSQKKSLPDMVKRVLSLISKTGGADSDVEMHSLTASSSTMPAAKHKTVKKTPVKNELKSHLMGFFAPRVKTAAAK